MKLNSNNNAIIIETINILSLGTKQSAKIDDIKPIIKGVIFCKFLYCSMQRTTKSAVKENSKPAVLNFILEPTIAPRVEPKSQ